MEDFSREREDRLDLLENHAGVNGMSIINGVPENNYTVTFGFSNGRNGYKSFRFLNEATGHAKMLRDSCRSAGKYGRIVITDLLCDVVDDLSVL